MHFQRSSFFMRAFLVLAIQLFMANVLFSQTQFVAEVGGPLGDMARSALAVSGGYLVSGSSMNASNGEYDISLAKTDLYGNVLWTNSYGTLNCDQGFGMAALSNGGYVLCGSTIPNERSDQDIFLVLTNQDGSETLSYYHGGDDSDEIAYDVIQTSDGGFLVCGLTNATADGRNDVLLLKFAVNGTVEWEQVLTEPGDQEARGVVETASGYAVAGRHVDPTDGDEVLYLLTDLSGNLTWSQSLGGEDAESGNSIVLTNDNSLLICGITNSFGISEQNGQINDQVYLIKSDLNGDTLFTTTIGDTLTHRASYDVVETSGGFVVCGIYRDETKINEQAYWLKVDGSGSVIWEHTWDNSNSDVPRSVIATNDGGFLMAGHTFGIDSYQMLMIKTDQLGVSQ